MSFPNLTRLTIVLEIAVLESLFKNIFLFFMFKIYKILHYKIYLFEILIIIFLICIKVFVLHRIFFQEFALKMKLFKYYKKLRMISQVSQV